jgi:DNA-binding transcriptional ArsR family regulator
MRRDVFQAIGDPTRRAILVLIAMQAVSKHIKVLTECQLLEQKKVGREIFYHFNPAKMQEIDKWLNQFKSLWEDRFNQLDDVLNNLKS